MDEIIAYCGFDCSQCPSFQATIKNDTAALESIARKWPSNSIRITAKGMARLFGNTPLKILPRELRHTTLRK